MKLIKNESKVHEGLKEIGREKLIAMGCDKIIEEFTYKIEGKRYVIDLAGYRGEKLILLECGNVKQEKLEKLKSEENIKFIHLDYDSKEGRLAQKLYGEKLIRILIGTTETGKKGIGAPTKTITLKGTSVNDIHKKIKEMLENIK